MEKVCGVEVMSLETELKEIKNMITQLDKKINNLLEERDNFSLMKLSEKSLEAFLSQEPDLYTLEDVKKAKR